MIKITSFCGCFSLKQGVFFISILHFILSLSGLIIVCIKLQQVEFILISFINLLLSIISLIGTVNENVRLIFPCVCVHFTGTFVLFPYNFIRMAMYAFKSSAPGSFNVWLCVGGMFSFGVGIYIFIIIYGFYQELLHKKLFSSNTDSTVYP